MRLITFLLFISIFHFVGFSQEYILRGFVTDQKSGEPIGFEKIKQFKAADSSIVTSATSDDNGFFTIPKVKPGKYLIKVDNPAYKSFSLLVDVSGKKLIINVKIELEKSDKTKDLDAIRVTAAGKIKKTDPQVSQIRLDKKGLERIPSMGAENDIIGAFSVTPGVVTTGDQGGQLYVRGGTPIQNKVLLDGMTIYQPFHSIGFFSIFETELVKNVDVYTGGFDAKYGGRISSIMDISYRDGAKNKFGGKVSVSPFLAKLVLEGPIGSTKNGLSNNSYVFSAKHSLLDYTSKSLYTTVNEGNGLPFNFTDLYGKLTFGSKGGSKVSVFGFHNRDSVNYGVADLNWIASGGGLNFMLIPTSSSMLIKGHVNGSSYSTTFAEAAQQPRESSINGFDLGFDFTYFLKNESELNYGFNFSGFNTNYKTTNEVKRVIEIAEHSTEIGLYTSYRLIKNRWVIQPSIRVQVYSAISEITLEPRIAAKYNATEKFRLKLSGGRFTQNFTSASSDKDIVNLFNGILTAPQNVQSTFVTQFQQQQDLNNGLQKAWHAIIGAEYDLGKDLMLNVEAYYKYFDKLSNINQNKIYDDVAAFSQIDDVYKKNFIIEDGVTYGLDVLLKYSKNRIFLWGVYSYGNSQRWDGFNFYNPVFDRRHNINIVGTYLFGKKKELELSIRWNLGSGLPYTPTAGYYQGENFNGGVTTNINTSNPSNISLSMGDFNSQRLPYYHRLDVTVKKQFTFKNKSILEMIGSVTNVYNRNNIFYVNRITGKEIYQFPFLPSVGISYKF
ncbi:MAG: hypothetical protein RIT10_177 [Bacteroidota bacterium]|jgi:hypothetical protein